MKNNLSANESPKKEIKITYSNGETESYILNDNLCEILQDTLLEKLDLEAMLDVYGDLYQGQSNEEDENERKG